MIGGYFDEHPWGTFDAPVIVEDPAFPGVKQGRAFYSTLGHVDADVTAPGGTSGVYASTRDSAPSTP